MRNAMLPIVRAVARRMPAPLTRRAVGRPRLSLETFGTFERGGAPPVPLLEGYRDLVKRGWRANWWPVATLLALEADDGVTLPLGLEHAAARIRASRTLPIPPQEIADGLTALFGQHPEYFAAPIRFDPRYASNVLEPVTPHSPPIETYRGAALAVRSLVEANGFVLRNSRVLDVGCASGSYTFALGALAGEVVGIDLDVETYVPPAQRAHARALLLPVNDDHRVHLEEGDVMALRFPDESFDVVVSNTVLEHVLDLAAAFRETRRVLRRGGMAIHGVQPWFGPDGGHGLCTLDFPWGHVRLDDEEFTTYERAWRPLEAMDAIAYHRNGFQRPRLTLDQSKAAARDAGFEVLNWRETRVSVRDVHSGLVSTDLLTECRRRHPAVTKRDLLTLGYSAALRRR